MDQSPVVIEQIESGRRLIEALEAAGIDLRVAFWAKRPDEGQWYLYLALPMVDEVGPLATYRLVGEFLREMPDPWVDLTETRVIGLKDTLVDAALAVTRRKPRAYPGMTHVGGGTLGGVEIDGAYIYPPSRADTPA